MQHQPTTHLAQELLMNAECCGSSSQGSGRPLEVDNDQLRGSLKLILLQLHEKLLKSSSIILWSFGVWSRLERWKTLISGCLMNWLQIKKNHHFEVSSSLIICNNSKLFHGLWYATKSGFYTTVNNQFSCWTKTKLQCTSQGQTCAKKKKKVTVTVWQSAASLIHYSFLNLRETITYEKYAQKNNEMHQKLQCHQPASVNRKGPIFLYDKPDNTSHNQRFESWTNWATKFFLICHIHLTSSQPTITSSSTPITFCTKNTSTASRRQKMFSKSSSNPQTDFYATGMNKLISYWQTFWLLLFLFWLIKTCLNLVIII